VSNPVEGHCDPRFAAVRRAFEANLESGAEVGAAVAVYVDGEPVVDLWGGWVDREHSRPWARDTICTVYSTTKGLTTVCAHRMVEQGRLDLDAPVAQYWPEFAQCGKEQVPVHMLLSHRVGLHTTGARMDDNAVYDWEAMAAALAETAPFWEPGTRHGYHGLTFGWLVGEVVRRVAGKSLGAVFRDEVAIPLGLDTHIGTGPEHDPRIATVYDTVLTPEMQKLREERMARLRENADPALMAVAGNLRVPPNAHNSIKWRRSEIPAVNAHTDARSVAKLYAALSQGGAIDGYQVLAPESIARATTEQASGPDALIMMPTRFALGFWLSRPEAPLGPNPNNFGHPGLGGSVGFADPDRHIGFGYVMNQLKAGLLVGGTGERLVTALYESLG
jgi:CubicO group peptidase (beta-lactamase class C family)